MLQQVLNPIFRNRVMTVIDRHLIKILTCLLLTFSATFCMAEEIQQGRIYGGGSFVESSQTGIGLTIPKGWQGAWPKGSEMFVLESAELKANIFMAFQPGDEAELKTFMSKPIPLDSTVQLVPVSAPKKNGNIYIANYTVAGAPKLSGFIAAQILPPSRGVAFMALSVDVSTTRQVEQVTLKLANGLTVKPPAAKQTPSRQGVEFYRSNDGSYVSDGKCSYFSSDAGSISTCD
jgi:hypothetical protein